MIVQVNGRLRGKLSTEAGISEADLLALAKADEKVAKEIAGKQIVKTIVVPNKLVNIVVKQAIRRHMSRACLSKVSQRGHGPKDEPFGMTPDKLVETLIAVVRLKRVVPAQEFVVPTVVLLLAVHKAFQLQVAHKSQKAPDTSERHCLQD